MSSVRERLAKYTSCDVADGLSKLGHKHGGYLEDLQMISPNPNVEAAKIVGEVFIVKFVPREDTDSPKLKGNYIDVVPAGSIIFISQPEPHINAVYGGLMSLRAQVLGAQGVIVDGRVRDVKEHRDIGFPVFAKGVGTTAGGAVCFPTGIQVPCAFNSVVQHVIVNPGDYLIADVDGVVLIPGSLVGKVLDIIPAIVDADEKCAVAIKEGMSVEESFKKFRGK